MRKRAQLVRHRVTHALSIQNLITRATGHGITAKALRQLTEATIEARFAVPEQALAIKSNLRILRYLEAEIHLLEKTLIGQAKLREDFKQLLSVPGIGLILALTIMLETADIRRFPKVGHFSSYCRCVDTKKLSNGKKKGKGNVKNGNRYLAWAFVEAANFAIRYDAKIKRFYQHKKVKTNVIVAIKAVAHKLARACYFVLRDHVAFDVNRAFV